MKVIFLDIDGVLNKNGRKMPEGTDALDDDLVKLLRGLVKSSGAYWVLSSTWRLIFGASRTIAALQRHGWPEAKETFLGETPHLRPETRGAEITAWLSRHPDVEEYVILDDMPEVIEGHSYERHVVRTIGTVGLTIRQCQKAYQLLRGESVRT